MCACVCVYIYMYMYIYIYIYMYEICPVYKLSSYQTTGTGT